MELSMVSGRRRGGFDLAGKTVLITGAGQGIGYALAQTLRDRGARLALVDVDPRAGTRLASGFGRDALVLTADVRDRPAMSAAVAEAIAHFGGLDVVVANAGVTPTPSTLRTMADDEFDRVVGINLTGAYNTIRPALGQIADRRGHVVIVCSCAAFAPGMGGSPYMISKSAVEQLGRALRVELAVHGASAGLAYFGVVETAMTHDMFDTGDLGREIEGMLPWPLNRRITADRAAHIIADGIAGRSPMTIAPAGWQAYSWLRGILNPVLDRYLSADRHLQKLLRSLEEGRT
ncbi:short-chain dehydrogenase/reductase [Nocardia flavorosea]|uniref:SDR family NAD(P)-dependent oxidoreductase n=1 Tax=Nocardia flavorosea TaxID=53429 RepID=A0A846YPJ7_9NOCA|nr:short-chain dehydrogenase/reductase [Nocardia flavorosea]NKY61055.1 SDR family NAD(P)-dependent oxidoreductase [Nocardia flavorosea]